MTRWNQLHWLADGDILRLKELEKTPILDYFLLLDKKIGDMKKAERNARSRSKRNNQL